jgi:CotH kinase protein/Lamin Tail Domain/Bacterial Ig domain/Immunoglobulin I-set domain/Bacterial TSP3 repeat
MVHWKSYRLKQGGRCLTALLIIGHFTAATGFAQLRISEFMASNTSTNTSGSHLVDEDGDPSDWIEIQNFSPTTVNLFDWSLTDSAGNLTKWKFPATNLPPGEFLVVFASNKDRRTPGARLHTNFKLDAAGEYLALVDPTGTNIVTQFSPKYPGQVSDVSYGFALTASNVTLVATGATARVLIPSVANGGSTLDYTWTGNATNEPFDVASWTSGGTGIGFNAGAAGDIGLNVQSSMLNNNASAFIRLPFVLNNPTNYSLLTLRIKYDDGFVAWINGVELTRANAPIEDFAWNSSATMAHAASGFESLVFGIATNLLQTGTNILAIQGLNVAATNNSFLIFPELTGTTVAGEIANGAYFTQPTPGTENLGGAATLGPGIANVTHTPNLPLDSDPLVVTAKVFPTARAVSSVTLHYRVMFNTETNLPMYDDGTHGDGAAGDGVYGATIPASASTTGEMVRYYITALDVSNVVSRLPVFSDPASTAEYFGTVVNPNYVTSAIPIIHLFASPSVLQPGPTTSQIGADSQGGGRVSLFYDGEFYDNINMNLRGNTTAWYNKKSHRLNFNREHPFRYSDSAKRVRKTSFEADYPDPSYMRQGMSFWLADQLDVPPPFCIPVRLQLNGAFYELATHSDVQETEMLERIGYNPTGAYYANVGTAQPGGYSTAGFEKKTRLTEDNTDYNNLINALAPSMPVGQKLTNLFDRLDVSEVISYMVQARFTHQNDDVWAGMALYHDNDGDDLWRILPYDQNLSWGAAWMDAPGYSGIQVTNDDLKSFPMYGSAQAVPSAGGGWNGMYDLIFQVPQTREMFLRSTRTMLDAYVEPPGTPAGTAPVDQTIIQWRNLIAADAQLDRAWWGWPDKSGQCNFDPGVDLTNGVNILLNDFVNNRRMHFYGKHSVTNTALPIGITKTSNAGIPLAQPANAVVSIAGWDYNPASGNQDEEYVLLSNANGYAVDISGWKLDGGIQFKFRFGTVIPAGGTLYVSPNTKAFRNRAVSPRGGQGLFVVGPYSGRLNAWGESLKLTDDASRLVSSNSFVGNPSPAQRYLRVTEIMYNPSPFLSVTNDEQQFEYVELKNISTNVTLNLAGVRFTNGIYFNFTGSAVTSLTPGQTVLLVRNQAAFSARYGGGLTIAGQFAGALANGGDTLRLEDAVGEKILEFPYNNSWYPITDGLGFSLVIVDENAPWYTWGDKASWRASGNLNGSPGVTDPAPPVFSPIIVNEVLTHTDLPELDSIELYNPTINTVNIGGWFLTDDFYKPKKYRIPNGTTISPKSYLVFNENQFNTGPNAFRFSEYGEFVYLFSGDANTNLTGYVHGFEFGESPNGVSFGCYTNSQTNVFLVLQSAVTLGTNNAYPRVGPIVISEIMYHPPDTNGVDNDLDEFIELQNITGGSVPLYCSFTSEPGYGAAAATNTWRLRNAVDFDFPTNKTLNAGARLLVVGFDPTNTTQLAAFRAKYGVSNSVAVYGPWKGKLDNSSETIELKQPDKPDVTPTNITVPYIMIDEVHYEDHAPWPAGADGLGNSLQRVSVTGFGNDPTNWFAAGQSAGRATVPDVAPTVSITAPTNGAVLVSSNGVTVSVVAGDTDGSLALVQLFADGTELARWTATSSNYLWSSAPSGFHELKARATDNLGAITECATITFALLSTAPPTVTILAPTNGSILVGGSSVTLSANATSGGGPASSVIYYLDGNLIGGVGSPFNLSWTANPPGYHTLSAIASDAEGQTSPAASVSMFVQATASNPVLIPAGSSWRYLDNGINQGTVWLTSGFVDSTWSSGFAKLGFNNRNSGFSTILSYGPDQNNKYATYYFRQQFVVPTLAGMTNLYLEVQRDDGVAVYLNGTSLYRNNLPSGTLTYSQLATNCSDNGNTWQTATLPLTNLLPGTNLIAAEVHQSSLGSSDIVFDLHLTLLGAALGPAITAQPQSQHTTNGQTINFAVTAIGTGPLAYQWQHSGTNLPGATTNSLILPAVSDANIGDYQVIVTNGVGAVTSFVATLTVIVDDTDADGMPDAWESANGTNPNVNDANDDPDHDGLSNYQEFLAGTSPTNAGSVLKFESMTVSGTDLALRFTAMSNLGYTVQFQPQSGDGAWQKWQDIGAAPSNRILWLTNSMSLGTDFFFRIVTPLQP